MLQTQQLRLYDFMFENYLFTLALKFTEFLTFIMAFSTSAFCLSHFCMTWVKAVQQFFSTVSKMNTLLPLFKHIRINLIPVACNKPLIFDKKSPGTIKDHQLSVGNPHLSVN